MAKLTEKWNESLHRFGESKVVAPNSFKAFDRVEHKTLPFEIKNYFLNGLTITILA